MAEPEAVILVHGLWVHGAVLSLLRRRVARYGYRAMCYSYPSMRCTLTQNAEDLARYCARATAPKVHFIGHSLGGLVVLRMLETAQPFAVGRAVLMGTPYGGSLAARRLMRLPGGSKLVGRSVPEWLGRERSEPLRHREIGVIAGRVGIGLGRLVAPAMGEPNDGVVRVSETRFAEMRDHIVLDVNHTGMVLSRAVAAQAIAFLKTGAFEHR